MHFVLMSIAKYILEIWLSIIRLKHHLKYCQVKKVKTQHVFEQLILREGEVKFPEFINLA